MSARDAAGAVAVLAAAFLSPGCREGNPAPPAQATGGTAATGTGATGTGATGTGATGTGAAGTGAAGTSSALRADERVDALIYDCPHPGPYDRNLADIVEVLASKLVASQPDPMHHAKAELASMGTAALPEIARRFDRCYTDPMLGPELQNALDVAARMEVPEARELLLRALAHPRESVRDVALTGLALHHLRAEDYELLLQHLEFEVSPRLRPAFASALSAADPARAAAEYLGWIEAGRHPDVWEVVLSAVVLLGDPALDARCARLFAGAPLIARDYLAAAALRAGSAEAEEFLLAELAHEEGLRRTRALQALAAVGRLEALPALLAADPDPAVRGAAAAALAASPDDPRARDALRGALDDPDPQVRAHCAGRLCLAGDEVARERALAGLRGSHAELQEAMQVLPPAMRADPELAARAFEALELRFADEERRPLEQQLATLQAVGLTPLRAAAEWLYERGLATDAEEVLGLAPHRWFAMQVANTGAAGRELLIERLARTSDPVRRLDLLYAIASDRGDEVRELLLERVQDDAADPFERLFAAERLVRVGPAAVVAPVLKRVALRVPDGEARRALACLLWTWY